MKKCIYCAQEFESLNKDGLCIYCNNAISETPTVEENQKVYEKNNKGIWKYDLIGFAISYIIFKIFGLVVGVAFVGVFLLILHVILGKKGKK